jgi:alkylation response protein AidB-like acyl-CoA dehydrogenase
VSGDDAQRDEYLPGLIAGKTIAAWAVAEPNDRWDVDGVGMEATADGDGIRLSGTKSVVQDAHVADVLLVAATVAGGVTQFLVPRDTPGVEIVPLEALDLARRFSEVRFDGARLPSSAVVGEVGGANEAVARQLDVAAALICAETVGTLDRCYEMTLDYAKTRKAFGRVIGSFQALKHRLADMLLWLEASKAAAVAAAMAIDHDVDRAETVSIAKSYISDRGPAIVRDCLQLHGGIGFTWEFDLHLFLRRAESNAALYGGSDRHRDRLASMLGM